MRHLVRAGALLVLFIAGFVGIRALSSQTFLSVSGLSPAGVNALEWSSKPAVYEDSDTCTTCHSQEYGTWKASRHGAVACETCHGAAQPHIERKVKPVAAAAERCTLCHALTPGRPGTFPQIDPGIHGPGCINCHDPHSPAIPSSGAVFGRGLPGKAQW